MYGENEKKRTIILHFFFQISIEMKEKKLLCRYFHSINPGFDAEADEKFLNGIY